MKIILLSFSFFLFSKTMSSQCHSINEDQFTFIPPPSQFSAGLRSAIFDITYNAYTSDAQIAFDHAADIWSSVLNSDIPIKVNTYFAPLGSGLLGITLPNGRKDFPNAPVPGVWYASCLANALSNIELNSGENDMDIFMNSSISWYFGTDGNCPAGKFDFVSVVLHELCHGLGFVGLAKSESNLGSFGMIDAQDFFPITTSFPFPVLEGKPGIFDRFLVNTFDELLTDTLLFPNNSAILDAQFTSNGVFFNGPVAVSVSGGTEPRIYAPGTFALGSSIVHLNESTYPASNPNTLMTPNSGTAEATHDPGQITMGILKDIGWSVNYNVGTGGTSEVNEIAIFPNPVTDQLTIYTSGSPINAIEITDLTGRKILEVIQPDQPINVSCLPKGLLLVNLTCAGRFLTTKFIKL